MKTKITLLILVLFALTLSLNSCDKDETEEVPPTKTEILTKAKWNWDKVELYDGNTLIQTIQMTGEKWEFKTNHTLYIYEPDNSIDDELQWDINYDGTILYITEDNYEEIYLCHINTLTDNKFEFYFQEDVGPIIGKKYKAISYDKTVYYLSR